MFDQLIERINTIKENRARSSSDLSEKSQKSDKLEARLASPLASEPVAEVSEETSKASTRPASALLQTQSLALLKESRAKIQKLPQEIGKSRAKTNL